MIVLFLHGWHSTPGGVKPTYFGEHGHQILNPALSDDSFDDAVRVAQEAYDEGAPDLVVGSSRGGAVAMNINSGDTPLLLICPAWKHWGESKSAKPRTVIMHSPADDRVSYDHSVELVAASPGARLVAIGHEHRMAEPETLAKMLEVALELTAAR